MRLPSTVVLNLYLLQGKYNPKTDHRLVSIPAEQAKESSWVFQHYPEELCMKRWNNGLTLYYLLNEKDQPCSFIWSRIGPAHFIGELNKQVIYPYNVNCLIDAITPPPFRGNGYYPKMIKAIAEELNAYPSIIYATKDNIISNKGIKKSGFTLSHIVYRFFEFIKVVEIDKEQIKIHVKPKD